ncbi:pyridoxamine 5'-phosphate oxidase family protein [Ideonella sp. DXS29W]|uniref:Pyridoxamine 5'-phosphate oxidase family protein n=1 Tax=Ideonella lacteola TaxID=2984193 RepID=A0ABU9BSJ2_9BURK
MSNRPAMPPDAGPVVDLATWQARLWAELGSAARDKAHPWRTPVLATVGGAHGADGRVVVLREVDESQRSVVFFTDARSPKVEQISRQPQGTLVMWSAPLGWQLRLGVHLQIETSGLAVSSHWARLRMTRAAQDYLAPRPPGTALTALPQRESRAHFALVTAQVLTMDWLWLDPAGHRRAVFDGQGARWVQP